MEWLRWYHGTSIDPKWRTIARRAGVRVADVVAVWATMLEDASQSDGRGTLDSWCAEDVASALDLDPEQVQAIYDAMQGKVREGDQLTGWEKRQPKREDPSTDRVRAHRERKRERNRTHETQCNAGETQCNAPEEIRGEERTTTETVAKATGDGSPNDGAPETESDPEPQPTDPAAVEAAPVPIRLSPDATMRAALSFRLPEIGEEEDLPPALPPPEKPDAEQVFAENRGRIAGAVREHAWAHRGAPQPAGRNRKWGMENELSIAKELLKQYTPDELLGGMEHWRRVHSVPDGTQWSLAFCYAEGQRWRMELAVDAWRNAEIDAINLAEYVGRRHAS